MQSWAARDASVASDNVGGPKPLSIESAVGNAFLQLLAEAGGQGQDQRCFSPDDELVQEFARDVKHREKESSETYDGFVDLAALAAVTVLVYGSGCPEGRPYPAPLTLYRRMLSLVKHATSGIAPSSDSGRQSTAEDDPGLNDQREAGAVTHQKLQHKAYDSRYADRYEAGAEADSAKRQSAATDVEEAYSQGFSSGQRRLMNSEIAFAFARGQEAEQQRIRACLEERGYQNSNVMDIFEGVLGATTRLSEPVQQASLASTLMPDTSGQQPRQYSSRGSELSHASPAAQFPETAVASGVVAPSHEYPERTAPQSQSPAPGRVGLPRFLAHEGDRRGALAICVFCGVQVSQNSILRHKRRHHAAELAAAGVPLHRFPCWWPGCGQLQDNFVHSQLTTHLQRKHNFSPPGDPNAFTENIKYIRRMPIDLQISIIAEAAQQLNAVKLRIQDLEARLRRLKLSYASRHALPDPRQLHESRPHVLSALFRNSKRLPFVLQELRQLTRARGLRSHIRSDEGTWWEVADDLEAGLDSSSKLARAVAALAPPGPGPTIPLSPATVSEAPNMHDPAWKPQHVPPMQPGWEASGRDGNAVWMPAHTSAQAGKPRTREPVMIKAEPEDYNDEEGGEDEDDKRCRELMAEITQRVTDSKEQSGWDRSSSDDHGGDSVDGESHVAPRGPGQPSRRDGSGRRKRSATSGSSPRKVKRY